MKQQGISRWWHKIDTKTIAPVIMLCIVGSIFMMSVSNAVAENVALNGVSISTFHFATRQVIFVMIGFVAMFSFYSMSRESIVVMSFVFGALCIAGLGLVLVIGTQIKGSQRWINLGFFAIQPSEVLKPFFIVVNGFILNDVRVQTWKKLGFSACIVAAIGFLLILEPDFGMTTTYLAIWAFQCFIANISWSFVVGLFGLAAGVGIVAFSTLEHVRYRIEMFLSSDDISYQVKRALQSIGEGGFFGKGPGNGETKYYLPDAHSDYIFAAIGEEGGFFICSLLLFAYAYLIFVNVLHFAKEKDMANRNIAFGILCMITLQVFISVGVNTNFLPTKGSTLPFISYGGSAMISMLISIGILLSLKANGLTIRRKVL